MVSELHTNYTKIAAAADFRSPRSSDQRRSGRLLVRPTPHVRALHALSLRQANMTRQTDSDFHYRCSFVPHGENTRLDTHTQTHIATAVMTHAASDFRICLQYAPVPSALHAIFKGLCKASCFPTVSLNNSGVFRVTKSSANTTALSCFHVSRTTGKSKFHCLSLGLHNIHTVSSCISHSISPTSTSDAV